MNEQLTVKDIFKDETELASFMGYTCIGGRSEDQDTYVCRQVNGRTICSVCDGMGGHAGGCVASHTAAMTLLDTFGRQAEIIPTKDAIVTAVNEANKAVYAKAQGEPGLRGMGTTLTLLVFDSDAAWVTHIGDSRIYQLRKGRKIYRTFDHSMVFERVKMGTLTEEQARQHPRSNELSKALGVLPDVDFTVTKLAYRAGDRFVLCCDGVWNCKPEPELIKMLTEKESLDDTVATTRETVETIGRENGGRHDNHTMIVVDMKKGSKYRVPLLVKIGRSIVRLFRRIKKLFTKKRHLYK